MQVQPTQLDAYNLIHNGALAFSRAEQVGMRIDVAYCEKKKKHLTRKIKHIKDKLETTVFIKEWKKRYPGSFNMNSDAQLGNMLYKVYKIDPPKTTASGAGATDEESLNQIDMLELKHLIQIRKLRKIRDTYLDAFLREQVGGIIHPAFNLHTVRTFRSSSNNPNFQNIPKRDKEAMTTCRRAIFPRPGHQLLEVDFSGLEVSIAACYHKDPTMIKYLTDPHSDMHGDMAAQIFMIDNFDKAKHPEHKTLRNATKNGFVFPQFYGDYYGNNAFHLAVRWGGLPHGKWKKGQGLDMPGGIKLSDHMIRQGIKSYDQFVEHMKAVEEDFWGRRFYRYQKWKERWIAKYQRRGYFDMYTGFRCSGVMRKNEVINYPVQGAAFHCLLWSFIELDRILQDYNSKLIGQIHDAVILDVDPAELDEICYIIKRVTCKDLPAAWDWITVPLDVDADLCPVDGSWNMKESYKLPEV